VRTDVSEGCIASIFRVEEINPDLRLADNADCHLLACWFLAELISSTLRMEAICSSETSVETQRTTRRYTPEDDTLHNHRCENIKSYSITDLFSSICLKKIKYFTELE
jgi:hypothetical protein